MGALPVSIQFSSPDIVSGRFIRISTMLVAKSTAKRMPAKAAERGVVKRCIPSLRFKCMFIRMSGASRSSG